MTSRFEGMNMAEIRAIMREMDKTPTVEAAPKVGENVSINPIDSLASEVFKAFAKNQKPANVTQEKKEPISVEKYAYYFLNENEKKNAIEILEKYEYKNYHFKFVPTHIGPSITLTIIEIKDDKELPPISFDISDYASW